VLLHLGADAVHILEETHMAQHIHLIEADGLAAQLFEREGDILFGSGEESHAGAREGDLRGGAEHKGHVGRAGLLALVEQVKQRHVLIDLMDCISVIPEDTKILRGRLEARDAAHGLVGIDAAERVRVLRHAPHALDGRVADELLDQIHVGAGRGHRDRDELEAEGLRDPEVAVVARGRAEPFDLVQLAPRLLRVQQAVRIGLGDRVVHEIERGVAADEALLGPASQNVRKQALGRRQTGQLAVVAHVDAVGHAVLRLRQHGQNVGDQIQLGLARLASGHIQLEALCLPVFITGLDGGIFGLPLRRSQIFVRSTHVFRILSISGNRAQRVYKKSILVFPKNASTKYVFLFSRNESIYNFGRQQHQNRDDGGPHDL